MTDMTEEQRNSVRNLVEEFRNAALYDIERASMRRGGGPSREDVEALVKFDTWLKLDDAEQARKAAAKKSGPQLC